MYDSVFAVWRFNSENRSRRPDVESSVDRIRDTEVVALCEYDKLKLHLWKLSLRLKTG